MSFAMGLRCYSSHLVCPKRSSQETMFTQLFIKVFERMHGRALAAAVAEAANGAVTDRTVRNWLCARTSPGPADQAVLQRNARLWLEQSLEEKDWPPAAREAYVEGLNACPGIVSGFVFGLTGASDSYPASSQLARDIDWLELKLHEHRTAGNVAAYAEELLTTEWLLDEHFINPDRDGGAEATRRQLREAGSWEELAVPLAPIIFNLQFQLLATLDLEFCRDYLKDFAVDCIFRSLLPRLNPRLDLQRGSSVPIVRDAFHYPARRLLDVMACMRSFRRNRKWPRTIPTVHEVAAWSNSNALTLTKYRMGRTFALPQFFTVWEGLFAFLDAQNEPPTPTPLFYAASVFTELFVKGSREKRDLAFIVPDPEMYPYWWAIQRQRLQFQAKDEDAMPWMPGLL